MKSGSQKRALTQYHSMSIIGTIINCSPRQKNHWQEKIINYRLQEKMYVLYIFYKKSITPETHPMRNHHLHELSPFSNGLLFRTTHPYFFLFPHKIISFPLLFWISLLLLLYSLLGGNCNFLLYLNKLIFYWYNFCLFYS